jgi:anti-anti-sigma factor
MKTKKQNGLLTITPGSELNSSTITKAAPQLRKALDKSDGCDGVLLDLTDTVSHDSATLKLLLAAKSECQNLGLDFHVQPTEAGKKFLTSLSLHRRMSITTQEAEE